MGLAIFHRDDMSTMFIGQGVAAMSDPSLDGGNLHICILKSVFFQHIFNYGGHFSLWMVFFTIDCFCSLWCFGAILLVISMC